MAMIMLDVSRHSIKYSINVSLANCSSMAYREVPFFFFFALAWMKSWLTNGSVAVCHSRWCVFEICSSDFRGARRHSTPCINVFEMQDDLVCTLRLFAVNGLLYHKIFHNDDTLALRCDQDKLGLWADRWPMVCNPTKCYKIFLYRSKSPAVKDYIL